MIDRQDALKHILDVRPRADAETVPLQQAVGRILAEPVIARLTQPPANMSAMDGYAVRFENCQPGVRLKVIGEAAAGRPFAGTVEPGECVRVFTGSVVPDGADHVMIQEDVSREGDVMVINEVDPAPRNIRRAGIDFSEGDELLPAGIRIGPRHLSVCAAANHAELPVRRRPRIALLSNGDELRPPGSALEPGQIIASNEYSLTALIEAWGGEAVNLGTSPDDPEIIRQKIETAENIDVFVPVGGASVGDYDHMKPVFKALGYEEVFSKIAIKPGKPTWFYQKADTLVLGLPGNPASALVCAHIFLRPLVRTLLGVSHQEDWLTVRLAGDLPSNGKRESFLRGHLMEGEDGILQVKPAGNQDSSLLTPFLTADVLINRPASSPALEAGTSVPCVRLD